MAHTIALAGKGAHDQQVIVIRLRQRIGKPHFRVIRLRHPGRDDLLGRHFRPGDVLADVPQGFLHLHAQNLVEVRVGVSVHSQDGALFFLILLVSDCSRRGVQAAGRLSEMIVDLKLGAPKTSLRLELASASTARTGPCFFSQRYSINIPQIVVFPTPPLPASAMV